MNVALESLSLRGRRSRKFPQENLHLHSRVGLVEVTMLFIVRGNLHLSTLTA